MCSLYVSATAAVFFCERCRDQAEFARKAAALNRERDQGAGSRGDPLPEVPPSNGVACPLAPSAETGGCGSDERKGQDSVRSERVDAKSTEAQASFVQAASDAEKKEAEEQAPTRQSTVSTQDDQASATEYWKIRLGKVPMDEDFPSRDAADVEYTHAEEHFVAGLYLVKVEALVVRERPNIDARIQKTRSHFIRTFGSVTLHPTLPKRHSLVSGGASRVEVVGSCC